MLYVTHKGVHHTANGRGFMLDLDLHPRSENRFTQRKRHLFHRDSREVIPNGGHPQSGRCGSPAIGHSNKKIGIYGIFRYKKLLKNGGFILSSSESDRKVILGNVNFS